MRYDVTHTTSYTYESPVSYGLNEVRLTPRSFPGQQVLSTNIIAEPKPTFLNRRIDYFGNPVTAFGVIGAHERFSVTATSLVDLCPETVEESSISWDEARTRLAAQADSACLQASEFLYSSPYVTVSPELAAYAQKTFKSTRPYLDVLRELTHRINKEFKYEPASTSIDTPIGDALRRKRGVCQDFAHVMIGALRSMGLAARYVSGYVRSGGKYQGAQASHAWVSAFVPGSGWTSFDPTNDVVPSDSHVTVAYGRDYGDVAPVKGVTLGGGKQSVKVEVYLKPASVVGTPNQ